MVNFPKINGSGHGAPVQITEHKKKGFKLPVQTLPTKQNSSLLYSSKSSLLFPSLSRKNLPYPPSSIPLIDQASIFTVAASHALGFAKFILSRQGFTSGNYLSIYDSSSQQQPSPTAIIHISAVVDTIAVPLVKSNFKTAPRKIARKMGRTRRRSVAGGGSEDGEDGGFFGDAGDSDRPFGGGKGGGGGWNSDRFGGFNWDDSSSAWSLNPALYIIYETMCWIAFSNCLHFALKKVLRIVGDGICTRLQSDQ